MIQVVVRRMNSDKLIVVAVDTDGSKYSGDVTGAGSTGATAPANNALMSACSMFRRASLPQ
jgi:hypothetical protein